MIVYQDSEIVVCIKSSGIISQDSSLGTQSMVSLLEKECACQIYPVHRLDKQVGGLMVYAKTRNSAGVLSKQVSDRTMEKCYLAVTALGDITPMGTMEDLLYFDRNKNKSYVVKRERRGVKKAVLNYKLISTAEDKALYFVRLETGRTHQIRVQFASRGLPLAGDKRYGSKIDCPIGLYSCKIAFKHPSTGKDMVFTSRPSESVFEPFNVSELPFGFLGE